MTAHNPEDNHLVHIATFNYPYEAHIARAVLESHDILSFVFDDEMNYTNFLYTIALGGIRLMVRKEDLAKAQEILASQRPLEEGEDIEDESEIT